MILKTSQGDLESFLIGANADKDTATHTAGNSSAYRIRRDTLHLCLNLLNHLLGVHTTRGWKFYAAQLKHHAEKTGLLRGKYRYCMQMVCRIYIYLMEGSSKN